MPTEQESWYSINAGSYAEHAVNWPTLCRSARRRGSTESTSNTGHAPGRVMLTAAKHTDLLTTVAVAFPALEGSG